MFGLSFGKIVLLAIVIIGAWRFFKWLEARGGGGPRAQTPQRRESVQEHQDGEIDLERDPETGVWRPRQ